MHKKHVALVGVAVLLVAFFQVYIGLYRTDHRHETARAIILKLPRSGSSWFTQLLNNDGSRFVSKEIFQGKDTLRFSRSDQEIRLYRALRSPTDKLARIHSWLPSGRFMEDYVLHPTLKLFRRLTAIGFTLNLEHTVSDLSWKAVVHGSSNVRLVLYVRSNLVKTVISDIRGRELKRICGISNMKSSRPNCQLPAKMKISTDNHSLVESVFQWQERYEQLFAKVQADPTLKHLPIITVYYEELLGDVPGTMFELQRFLHPGDADQRVSPVRLDFSAGWVKRTPDDLSKLLENFDEWDRVFAAPGCALYRAMLRDTSNTVFPHFVAMNDAERQDQLRCKRHLLGSRR